MSNETVIASLKEKIDDLNQQAWEARINDSPKALELSNESVRLSREINYSKGLAEGLRSLGFCYVRLFKNDEAEPLLRESLALFQSLNDLKGQAVIYEYLGIIERNWGNLGRSLELLLKGNELVQQVGPIEVETTTAYQIGVTYKHLGNHENALDYLYRSLALAEKIDLTLMVAYSTNIIGSIYFDNGNYEKALELYQQGLIIRRQSNDKWGEAGSLDNIGITYLKLDQLDKAIDYCKQSLAISQSTGDKKGEANALLHLADIYEQANDIANASKFSNESLEIRIARGDKRGEAEVLLFLANLHKNNNDADDHQVFEWLSAALNIANEIKAQDILSKAFFNLHEYYQEKGDYKRSLAQLESYLHIEKELHKNAINQKVSNLEISHKAEAINQQNKELTELNRQIEKANAELKVESSLERVRTAAMAMKEPSDMLEVCKIISNELASLDVKEIRNVQTAIFYEEKGSYMNYEYYAKHDKTVITETGYTNHKIHQAFADQMMKGYGEFYSTHIRKSELPDWISYQKTTNVFIDHYLERASSLNYYWFSLGNVALGISTYSPLRDGDINLFKRFRNVFELTYRRYLDIETAQAQAREAKIEAALERVRSRTMGMQKSEELNEIIKLLYEQMVHLNLFVEHAGFIIDWEDTEYTIWLADKHVLPFKVTIPYFDCAHWNSFNEARKNGNNFFANLLDFEEKNKFYNDLFNVVPGVPQETKDYYQACAGLAISTVLLENIGVYIENFLGIPYTDEENAILMRFGKVFQQTYTRFLDLQKAEAQTREALIEGALEKVRAKVMAMKTSNDLNETSLVFGEQMKKLGIDWQFSYFWLIEEGKDDNVFWITWPDHKTSTTTYSWAEADESFRECLIAWQQQIKIHDTYVPVQDVPAWLDTFERITKDAGGMAMEIMKPENFKEGVYYYDAMIRYGSFGILTNRSTNTEEQNIQVRFATEFERAYTRFLDLQKAEAQTREAQIETALEKIRSRSLAMHKSDELKSVMAVVFEKLKELGLIFHASGIYLFKDNSKDLILWVASPDVISEALLVNLPYDNEALKKSEVFDNLWKARQEGINIYNKSYSLDEKNKYFAYVIKNNPQIPLFIAESMLDSHSYAHTVIMEKNSALMADSWTGQTLSVEEFNLLKRVAKVFEQAYTRFLDLQKAEAQAKEAQIETALERIRARAMAMHSSDEIMEVANILREQMGLLNQPDLETSVVNLLDEDPENVHSWHAFRQPGTSGKIISGTLSFPKNSGDMVNEMLVLYNEGRKEYTIEASGQKLKDFTHVLITAEPEIAKHTGEHLPEKVFYHFATFKGGTLLTVSYQPPTDDVKSLQRRAASVFDMAYRRYLDLKKAEAQAREAQIETGLERVRSKTMAMHKSEEVTSVAVTLNAELLKLGFIGGSTIIIIDKKTGDTEQWTGFSEDKTLKSCYVPYFKHPFHDAVLDAWKKGEKFFVYTIEGDEKISLDEHYFSTGYKIFPENDKKWMRAMKAVTFSHSFIKYGAIHWGPDHLTDEQLRILQRFANVFEQTYTRFLDLQKAEASAREAQIEASLERVRTRTMAMQKSGEMQDVVIVLYDQLKKLGFENGVASIALMDASTKDMDLWAEGSRDGYNFLQRYHVKYFDHKSHKKQFEHWKNGDSFATIKISGADKREYDKIYFNETDFISLPEETKKIMIEQDSVVLSMAYMQYGALCWTPGSISEEQSKILQRFSKVFEQTYTRFLDLQKAEAQAREAQIEAALERVRSRAMAMQNSRDLDALISHVFDECTKLDLVLDRAIINIIDPKTLNTTWVLSNPETPAKPSSHFVQYHEYTPYLRLIDAWKQRFEKWHFILEGEEKKTWDRFLFYETGLSKLPDPVKEGMQAFSSVRLNFSFADFGSITLASFEPLTESQFDILTRFTKVFDLTYTRFNDLKQAEAQAREATIEVALERVRARALAMQQPEELKDVAQVLRTEMGSLGIEELETCSIYIHEKDSETAECWYALKDPNDAGKAMVADHFHLELNDTWVGREMKSFYSSDEKQTSVVMQGDNRKEWIDYCYKHSPVFSGFYGETIPDRTYHLYKFSHGYIGAAAPGDISAESWRLLNRAASVFSLAYSRFRDLTQARNDLIKLKEEKKRAEDALIDLQNAQKQLIQTEKMASLGELTAGIAHEIQNPLNFVNNFSDVSNELIEEMKDELATGNTQQAIEIANDVKDNLEKILHHGKRADAIVKGMLQHSRSSSGVKEPTDINNLADEYLRLAFHGYRAKDKSFNAKFETNFDNSIEKINVIPQDIGRVILNLINNAFYTVNEKRKLVANGYDPTVTVTTKKINDRVEISIKDNGNGIPQKMLDKIFQPFFTTKPTGQGTGLGLSLSYDIITKGHDGEIDVKTSEGNGAEFIISLPVN